MGRNTNVDFLNDTIESIHLYLETIYKIVLCDELKQGLGEHVKEFFPEMDLYKTVKSDGRFGRLYVTLSEVYK